MATGVTDEMIDSGAIRSYESIGKHNQPEKHWAKHLNRKSKVKNNIQT
jgi:hypothetical protein